MKKASPKKKKATSQNQFGVILEDINGKFDLIVEGQKASEQKLERKIESSGIKLERKIDELNAEFVEFRKDTESNFKQVFHYLSRIEDELMSIKTEIADIKKTLTQKEDKDRVALLEKRVEKLERQLAQTTR